MSSPQQPHGHPQQPGFPPAQPQTGQPYGQWQPGHQPYPQPPFQQQPYPQQHAPVPGQPTQPTMAYLVGGVSCAAALLGLFIAIDFIDQAIGTSGGITGETNPAVTDTFYWLASILGALTAVGLGVTGVLHFLRRPAAWIFAVVTGSLGLGMLLMHIAASISDEMNRGFGIDAFSIPHVVLFALGVLVLVMGVLPATRAALKPKIRQPYRG